MTDVEYAPILRMLREPDCLQIRKPIQAEEKSSKNNNEHTKDYTTELWTRQIETKYGEHLITSSVTSHSDKMWVITDEFKGKVFWTCVLKEPIPSPSNPSNLKYQNTTRNKHHAKIRSFYGDCR